MNKTFKVIDENNIEREASLITVIEVDKKEYAIYSIVRDENTVNIFVSQLLKNEDGKDVLKNITDEREKEKIDKIVKDIIKLPL